MGTGVQKRRLIGSPRGQGTKSELGERHYLMRKRVPSCSGSADGEDDAIAHGGKVCASRAGLKPLQVTFSYQTERRHKCHTPKISMQILVHRSLLLFRTAGWKFVEFSNRCLMRLRAIIERLQSRGIVDANSVCIMTLHLYQRETKDTCLHV